MPNRDPVPSLIVDTALFFNSPDGLFPCPFNRAFNRVSQPEKDRFNRVFNRVFFFLAQEAAWRVDFHVAKHRRWEQWPLGRRCSCRKCRS